MNQARRGYVPDDMRWFSKENNAVMQKAAQNVLYLINEQYDLKKAMEFVGNHYLLSERQRIAIMRCVCTDHDLLLRKAKECSFEDLYNKDIYIDGFNQIITLETFLEKGTLLLGMDGCVRDLAGLRGSYHLIGSTQKAVRMILSYINSFAVHSINFYLDKQVSNSGRLKTAILEESDSYSFPVSVILSETVDADLKKQPLVITTDSIILNECTSWYNLLNHLIPEEKTSFHIEKK